MRRDHALRDQVLGAANRAPGDRAGIPTRSEGGGGAVEAILKKSPEAKPTARRTRRAKTQVDRLTDLALKAVAKAPLAVCSHGRVREVLVTDAREGFYGPIGPCTCCGNSSQLRVDTALCGLCRDERGQGEWNCIVHLGPGPAVWLWFDQAAAGHPMTPADARTLALHLLMGAELLEEELETESFPGRPRSAPIGVNRTESHAFESSRPRPESPLMPVPPGSIA
jgi:hypothetical protein